MIARIVRWFRKRSDLRAYRHRLRPALVARYGRAPSYTPAQVRTTAEQLGLSTDLICYAYAMFCDRESFDEFHAARGEACDYDAMRDDGRDFGSDFVWSDALTIEATHGHEHSSGHHDHSNGHHDHGYVDPGHHH